MRHTIISMILLTFLVGNVSAQFKNIEQKEGDSEGIKLKPLLIPTQESLDESKNIPFSITPMELEDLLNAETRIQASHFDKDGNAIFFRGHLKSQRGKTIAEQVAIYMNELNKYFNIDQIDQQYISVRTEEDAIGMIHIDLQQVYKGIPVDGGYLKLHAKDGIIIRANGKFKPTPSIGSVVPIIEAEKIKEIVIADFEKRGIYKRIETEQKKFMPKEIYASDLIIHNKDGKDYLVYKVDAFANMIQRFVYFVDANTGVIIDQYKNYCSFHGEDHSAHNHAVMPPPDGPATATAQDLMNINRTINTYESGNKFYLIDAARKRIPTADNPSEDLFNESMSNMPNEPVGVIWTIDAFNTNPQNNNFNYDNITSNNNTWNNKIAVSAHYNGGVAYEYFKTKHLRNSINGESGNIISLINISDPETGGGFDNAFWNGTAMFYGNGNTAFEPLAEALDVAGHEMSHGVIQATANLTYQGESGALNESFADIFGVMMDSEDWFLGEDVAKTSVFPTGRLRDMSNPHNGGSQLGDPGWQPDNTSEQYTGSQDNGGVHINSGIVNHAYYLFATEIGLEKAEQIYYRALTEYLSASSKFIDLRASVEQAAEDLYGMTEKNAASSAFQSVGIGGGGNTTDYETDVEMNPGADFLLHADAPYSNLFIRDNDLNLIADPLSQVDVRSKPSVTDNGSNIFFVGTDNNIYNISIDWEASTSSVNTFDDQGVWRNVAISKDGSRIAALTDQTNNTMIVLDFNLNEQKTFELYNPTFTEGVSTGDVDFADAMEFDFTGEFIMYDQQSTITGTSGNIEYWDIGFINVFSNASNNFTSGNIQKLFTQLPSGTSVGNPTFSKNSPYIIAFDQIDPTSYKILGANIEANKVSEIFENGGLGYPSYNNTDGQLVYEFSSFFGTDIGLIELDNDKISPIFNTDVIIVENATYPVVFSNGERTIINTKDLDESLSFELYPNPVGDQLFIELDKFNKAESLRVFDSKGLVIREMKVNTNRIQLSTEDWANGMYFIQLSSGDKFYMRKIIKQ